MQDIFISNSNRFPKRKYLFVLAIVAINAIIAFLVHSFRIEETIKTALQITNISSFDKLVLFSILGAFAILLLFYGRIELAVITILPAFISWKCTICLMGLFNNGINGCNITISLILLGLGVGNSFFIMQLMINNYKYNKKSVVPYKHLTLLTAISAIIAISALFLVQKTIVSPYVIFFVFGLVVSLIISFTLIPALFKLIVKQRSQSKTGPITFTNAIISILFFCFFLANTITLTICIPILYLLPISRKKIKYFYHWLICQSSRMVVRLNFTIKKQILNKEKIDFTKPSIIVSNHQSHLDLVLILMLHPKIIVITNKWVWNNPFYGFVVRFADYLPMYKGLEKGFDKIKKKVEEGYSVLVFPEGTRTIDGSIKRFHQGAFKLADDLNLDIQPLLIHGAYECLPKTEFFLRSGKLTIKFFDRVKVETSNSEIGETYLKQAKNLTKLIRNEYNLLKLETEKTGFYSKYVIAQYIFKGPVLEWYVRFKLKLENNFKFINEIIPLKASIVDIGCGYGYLAYMLKCVSKDRIITGIDYDEKKIALANGIVSNLSGIGFENKDISEEDFPYADVYILFDVLHYMPENLQFEVLSKCMDKIPDNGMIIVRDADADLTERTKVTRNTEIQSVKIFRFNKAKYKLSFISGKKIKDLAENKGFNCERFDNSKRTSNITYIIRK